MSDTNIQETVKQKYGEAAKRAAAGGTACCGGGAQLSGCDPITRDLYSDAEKGALPEKAVAASLGCGNPAALAELQPGEIVRRRIPRLRQSRRPGRAPAWRNRPRPRLWRRH